MAADEAEQWVALVTTGISAANSGSFTGWLWRQLVPGPRQALWNRDDS